MNLLDLPDELLLRILNQVYVVDALCSLPHLHPRLDRLVFDPIYVRQLDFTSKSVENVLIDQKWNDVLLHISGLVTRLILPSHAMERILGAVHYPRLSSLSLIDVPERTLLAQLKGNSALIRLLHEQVTHLQIRVDDQIKETDSVDEDSSVFESALSLCHGLIDFTYAHWITDDTPTYSTLCPTPTSVSYPTLTKLNIRVYSFNECLRVLDGRFESLSTFSVYVTRIVKLRSEYPDCTKPLPKLKCFSLTSDRTTANYDVLVVPLLGRLANLEELSLYLSVTKTDCNVPVDGHALHAAVIARLPHLRKFQFSIITHLNSKETRVIPQSNEELRRSFTANHFKQVGSYVDQCMEDLCSIGHVYSLPFAFSAFRKLSQSFSGGPCDCVRSLEIETWSTVKHGFYKKIAESFPWIEQLSMNNVYPTAIEAQSNDGAEQHAVRITFPRLRILRVDLGHPTHLQYFLSDRQTHLPRLCELEATLEQLIAATNNFTSDEARANCSRVRKLILNESFVTPEHFHAYFPLLQIVS